MAKHMAGKNQRPYSAEDRARRAAKADPRSTASELTPETLYAKQSSQSEKRVPSSIENLHFTPKPPKSGPEGFEETREYPVPAAPQQEAVRGSSSVSFDGMILSHFCSVCIRVFRQGLSFFSIRHEFM